MAGAMLKLYGPMMVFKPADKVTIESGSAFSFFVLHAQQAHTRKHAIAIFCIIAAAQVKHPILCFL
jgi:hypothetical protein